jgi:acetamidase/formamidase
MKIATRETIDFITKARTSRARRPTYRESVAVDYHVTQVVDGTRASTDDPEGDLPGQ